MAIESGLQAQCSGRTSYRSSEAEPDVLAPARRSLCTSLPAPGSRPAPRDCYHERGPSHLRRQRPAGGEPTL